ncbi:hypothetical protein [Methylosinus sp. Sm6]|uniref:hypothetical protein n=1 Tax=Methylosinus sp. Sm6 TaxID=2866948 RepID=UPI001C99158C|nr:hypothetical protein [Methylosinus sp. Sm6]MBY6239697.1 hypothetical protein [Methylosinus sp. Sm6]
MADADSTLTEAEDIAPAAATPIAEPDPSLFRRALARLLPILAAPPALDIGRIAALTVVPVFCWVFYTTSSGMIDIMRRDSGDLVGVIGSMIGTTAILTMLAATSWSLGADLGAIIARRRFLGERIVVKTVVTAAVFLFVFPISAFFSFTYYYTNIFNLSSRKLVAETQPMELAADVLLPVSKSIASEYDAQTARMEATPGLRAYLDGLDALLQTANVASMRLDEGLQKSREGRQRIAREAARRKAAELEDAQAAARRIAEIGARIAALSQTVADLDPIIKSKEEEIVALTSTARQEEQLAADAAKGLDGLGAACGPNCESHRAKAKAAQKRIGALRETLVAPTEHKSEALRQRDALAAEIVMLRQKAESASDAAPAPSPAAAEEEPRDVAGAARRLAALRDQIRADPSWAKIRQAKTPCGEIVGAMRQAGLANPAVPADFSCEPEGAEAHDLLTARDEAIAGRSAFDQKCALDGAIRGELGALSARIRTAVAAGKSAASAGFDDAKRRVDDCVVAAKAAGLPEAEVQAFLKRSDTFLRTRSMDRNRFELAREAFLSMTPDATMALGVAIAQDAFMFVMKLLAEIFKGRERRARPPAPVFPALDVADGEDDDSDVRVMKALLRLSRPLPGERSAFDGGSSGVAELPVDARSNLIGLLNRLVREDVAHLDRKGVYNLDNRTLAEVEARLALALQRASRGGAASARMEALAAELAARDGARSGWRRRRSALDRYLTPRFPAPAEEDGNEDANAEARARGFG